MFSKFWKSSNIVSKNINNYDRIVNDFNCKHVWKCSTKNIIDNYQKNISNNHLEIGPGTGFFLNKKNTGINFKKLTLVDVNKDILQFSKKNLEQYYSNIEILHSDLFSQKISESIYFESVGVNYVLHCVTGNLQTKLDNLIDNLGNNKYNLFGASVICDPLHMNTIAEYELIFLNTLGIFNNNEDTYYELEEYLNNRNIKFSLKKQGYVAIFDMEIDNV